MCTTDIEEAFATIATAKKCYARYLKNTHKFRIEYPKTEEDALELDNENGSTMYADAIIKEIKNVQTLIIY